MTNQELHILKKISRMDNNEGIAVDYLLEVSEKELDNLEKHEYIEISIGEGFLGGVKTLTITEEGKKFIETFCDTCDCMPCDCDWGY